VISLIVDPDDRRISVRVGAGPIEAFDPAAHLEPGIKRDIRHFFRESTRTDQHDRSGRSHARDPSAPLDPK
jgi:hypothetical protein